MSSNCDSASETVQFIHHDRLQEDLNTPGDTLRPGELPLQIKIIHNDVLLVAITALGFCYTYSDLKGHCIEFKYYADGIHSGLTPPG